MPMNLFYENIPEIINVAGCDIPIITDFREHIKLIDMLNDDSVLPTEKYYFIMQYFKEKPPDFLDALDKLIDFVMMTEMQEEYEEQTEEDAGRRKPLYSFKFDYPYIFSAFLSEYGINLRKIPYLHWWEFKMLFDGLSEKTEIKQRIMYRSIDTGTIKDKDERKRIEKIQRAIRLPEAVPTDYEIGDAFGW